jgi:hypothetical protein
LLNSDGLKYDDIFGRFFNVFVQGFVVWVSFIDCEDSTRWVISDAPIAKRGRWFHGQMLMNTYDALHFAFLSENAPLQRSLERDHHLFYRFKFWERGIKFSKVRINGLPTNWVQLWPWFIVWREICLGILSSSFVFSSQSRKWPGNSSQFFNQDSIFSSTSSWALWVRGIEEPWEKRRTIEAVNEIEFVILEPWKNFLSSVRQTARMIPLPTSMRYNHVTHSGFVRVIFTGLLTSEPVSTHGSSAEVADCTCQ